MTHNPTPDEVREAGLLPCPFCGSSSPRLTTNPHAEMSWVACPSCGLEAPSETGVSVDDAVTYWNTRLSSEQAVAQSEGLVVPTWEMRCEAHPDHTEKIVTEGMIQARMQEEIDDLRAALSALPHTEAVEREPVGGEVADLVERLREGVRRIGLHDDNSTELFDVRDADEVMHEAADRLATLTPPDRTAGNALADELERRIELQIWKAEANFDENMKAVLVDCLAVLRQPSTDRESIRGEAFEEAAKVAETPFAGAFAPSHKQSMFRKKIATAIRALSPNPEPRP